MWSMSPVQALMTNIVSWNIHGLNWPTKQEELNVFLHKNNIGILGLLETKVKIQKVETIATKIFCSNKK